jgi:hypothetical protein
MTLQRHTGTHIALPPLPPIADVPLSPNAGKKKNEQSEGTQSGEPCQAEDGTQD